MRFFVPIALREHFGKKFLVFALGSGAGHEIRLKAYQLAHNLTNTCNELLENTAMKKYEIDLKNGLLKTDGSLEDHQRAMSALELLAHMKTLSKQEPEPVVVSAQTQQRGIKIAELVEQYFKLKKQLKSATSLAYSNVAKEFAQFCKKQYVADITESDVLRYQNWLASAEKNNSTRTIDNKISNLHTLFKFAIQQKHYNNENPAANKSLMTKKQRSKEGYNIFEREEVEAIFNCDFMRVAKERDKDYFIALYIALFTGMRVSEVASLQKEQFKTTENNNHYIVIRESKTLAGQREIPLYKPFFELIKHFIDSKQDKLFKYEEKSGKGAGNAIGKKFPRHLLSANVKREKLVFHSLRKFTNNEMKKYSVSVEARCQILGHEFDNVNSEIYSNNYSVDKLAEMTEKTFESIFSLTKKYLETDF